MIQYEVQLNHGVEAFGTGKTITANEVLMTCDEDALAREIHHQNTLIPEQIAKAVLQNFGKAAAELMSMGFAIQLKSGNDVLLRIYPDIHVKGGNINLTRAKELDPNVTDLTLENAGDLVTKAGVTIRARAEAEVKFTELLLAEGAGVERKGIVDKPFVERKDGESGGNAGGDNGGDNGNNGGATPQPGDELEP